MIDINHFNQALHVVNGDSAAGTLKFALRLGRDKVLVNEDQISCGPAPATADLSTWRSIRESFLKDMYLDWPEFSFEEYAVNGLLMNAERLGGKSPVIVWAACGLPDQLLLAWVVFLFDHLKFDLSKLRIVQFETLRPCQHVIGVGELSPENIRQFCPEPRSLNLVEIRELRRAWEVYTSSDPAVLSSYIAEPGPMPLLRQALSRLVYRYPDVHSGIGIADETLLRFALEKGPRAALVIGHTMACLRDTLDHFCDSYLFHRLVAMSSSELLSPLVSLSGNPLDMRESQVAITSFGQRVLAGEENQVQKNGINEWVGGVHLTSDRRITFRDGGSLISPR